MVAVGGPPGIIQRKRREADQSAAGFAAAGGVVRQSTIREPGDGNRGVLRMRILHTADWHLGDRLGRIDRTDDLRRAVERVADYCTDEKVDVLLVAGDLFSELAGAGRPARRHPPFAGVVRRLPARRRHHPHPDRQPRQGKLLPDAAARHEPGRPRRRPARRPRAARPALPRHQPDLPPPGRPRRVEVQFVLMPYPTPTRYLHDEEPPSVPGPRRKEPPPACGVHRTAARHAAAPGFDPSLPTVLSAHIAVQGSDLPTLFRLTRAGRHRLRRRRPAGRLRLRRAGPHPQAAVPGRPDARPLLRQHRAPGPRREATTTRASSCSTSARRDCAASRGAAAGGDADLRRRDRSCPRPKLPRAARALSRREARPGADRLHLHGRRGQPRGNACGSWKRSSRAGTTAT